ncbi:hypothetical protein [Streptomyces sp. 2-1]|uniref:hypothetical protein n=1 Tax=Streptomyces sp. 2-1 TaxID=412710 RepID=UPI003AFA96F6|nr:hypothetical protein [Streptomyces phaeochromogenes]
MSDPNSRSPFIAATSFEIGEEPPTARTDPLAPAFASPFVRSYRVENESRVVDPEAEEYTAFLGELYDEELNEALFELAGEAAREFDGTASGEHGTVVTDRDEARHRLEARYAPLLRELEEAIDALADAAGDRPLQSLSEAEVEEALETYQRAVSVSPALEHLFGGIGKALKKAAHKAVGLAKRGVKAVARYTLGALLRRLKPVATALLKQALTAGLKWVPPEMRPYAEQLARRLPLLAETEESSATDDATGDVCRLQEEFDLRVAEAVFADSEAAMEFEASAYTRQAESPALWPDPVEELGRARERLVSRLAEAEDGEDVTPEVEAFLPAVLPLLRLGLKVTGGRAALAATLARFVTPLIGRFVGKTAAQPLSRALVEAGLRLVQLEVTPQDEQRATATAVAAVVEDTVRKVGALPERILAQEALLEGFVLEAFEQAAAGSLPQILTEETYLGRPELRQDLTLRGAWVALPLRGVKRYRKYTRMPWINLSPYQVAHIRTFRGLPLDSVLHQRLGLPPGSELRARVHLYEVLPGTSVAAIAQGDHGVPGLAGLDGSGRTQLHPLTPEAAGLLLGEPALGVATDPRHLASPRLLGVGQRLYHLEVANVPGPRMNPMAGGRSPARPSQATVTLRFPDDAVVAELYLSEADAQGMAARLRRAEPVGRVLAPLVPLVRQRVGAALDGHRLRLVHGSVLPRQVPAALRRVPAATVARLSRTVENGLVDGLGTVLKDHRDALLTATEAPVDGVTVRVSLGSPPVMSELRAALTHSPGTVRGAVLQGPSPNVTVVAGHGPE